MAGTAHRNNARAWCLEQKIKQPAGQDKMTQVVHAKLHFETLLRFAIRDGHQARIIDQQVETAIMLHGLRDLPAGLPVPGNVSLHGQGPAAGSLDFSDHLVGMRL